LGDLRDTPTLSDSANHELTSLHPSGPPLPCDAIRRSSPLG